MFEIRLLPSSERGPDGQRLGIVTNGDFTERFPCHPIDVPVEDLPTRWLGALQALVQGASCVALVHDPRLAWVVYREGDTCFVQQRLALDSDFAHIHKRETHTEEGEPISEWHVPLLEIEEYMRTQPRNPADCVQENED